MKHHVHLGVTGLRRTGKTVFLTALIYQLTELGSRGLRYFEAKGVTLKSGQLSEPRGGTARFPYSKNLARLRDTPPEFPEPTVGESGCTVTFAYECPAASSSWDRIKGVMGRQRSHGTIVLHIHDYPGEYLLDVGMSKQSFSSWSKDTFDRMDRQCPQEAEKYGRALEFVADKSGGDAFGILCRAYAEYVLAARRNSFEFIQPARLLIDWWDRIGGEKKIAKNSVSLSSEDVPASHELPFVPLPSPQKLQKSFVRRMEQSYNDYVKHFVKPFVSRLASSDVHLVLVDVLRVLRHGIPVFNDSRECLAAILYAYNTTSRFAARIPGFKRKAQQVQFAATKADHANFDDRHNLTRLLDDLVTKGRDAIRSGIEPVPSEWFTSIRATEDCTSQLDGREFQLLRGMEKGSTKVENVYPGRVPPTWPDEECDGKFLFPEFVPRSLGKRNGDSLPHLNFDKIVWRILERCF